MVQSLPYSSPSTFQQWLAQAPARLQKHPAAGRQMLKDEAKFLGQTAMKRGDEAALTAWLQAWYDLAPDQRTRPLEAVMAHLVDACWRIAIESPAPMAVMLQQPAFHLGQPNDRINRTGQLLSQAAETDTHREDLLEALAPWVTPATSLVAYRGLIYGRNLLTFEAALSRLARHVPTTRPLAGWWTLAVLHNGVTLQGDPDQLVERALPHLLADLDAAVAELAIQRRGASRECDPSRFDALCDRLLAHASPAVQKRWIARDTAALPQTLAAQRQAQLAQTPTVAAPAPKPRRRI